MKFFFSPYNYDLTNSESIPILLLQHLYLVGITMLISLVIAIPLGILLARYRRLYLPIITIADLFYTIPGIALLGVLITVPWLGLNSVFTALIPLIIYTQLVLIRNTVAAIDAIDPLMIEVGRAMGMNPWQLFTRVTMPLALPVIVAGVRVATVTTIGIASLASLVNQGGLGDLIFKNIASTPPDYNAVLAGAILISVFAVVADLLLLALQTVLNRGRGAFSMA
jgi:osmoprotectant transport system permease protein